MKITTLILVSFLVCIAPMTPPSVVLAAAPGDDEVSEAMQDENSGNYPEAERKYREAIEKFKDSKRDLPLSFALDRLGNLYCGQNQLAKAAEAYKNVLEIRQAALARGTDGDGTPLSVSARKDFQKDLGLAMTALGSVYTRQKQYGKAATMLSDGLATIKTSWGPQHDCVGVALAAIGDLKFAEGNYAEAGKYYRQALAIRRKCHALNDPALSALVRNSAAVLSALRKTGH